MKPPYSGILSVFALLGAVLFLPVSNPQAQYSGSYASPTPGYGGTPTPAYNGSYSSNTSYVPTGPAATMQAPNETQHVTFQLPVGRAGHSFSMLQLDAGGVSRSQPTVVKGIATVTGTNNSQVASYLSVVGTLQTPSGGDWWLYDNTAQQAWPRNVRALVNSAMQSSTGSYYRYFAIPVSRSGHMLMVGSTASGWMPLTQGPTLALVTTNANGTAQTVSQQLFEAYAQVYGNFNVVDRTDGKTAPLSQTNLADSLWTVDQNSYPLRAVSQIVEGIEDGHWFDLASKAPQGQTIHSRVQAHIGAWGNSVVLQNGGSTPIPAGSASITAMVGAGMDFWLTREADGKSSLDTTTIPFIAPPSPTYGSGSSPGTAYYSLLGIYPPDPGRVLESKIFRVHWGNRRNHHFTVWRSDGYHTKIVPQPPPDDPYYKETIEHWDDSGHTALNPLDVAVFTASIDPDPTRTWWLRDDSNGQTFPLRQADVFDGWQPMHLDPPPDPILTVELFAGRRADSFVLDWHGIQSAPLIPDVAGSNTLQIQNDAGEYLYELPFVTFSLTDPLPYASGSIILTDTTTNESRTLLRGNTALIEWLSPPTSANLKISSSRWDAPQHTLVLHQSNGESWPVEKVATAGDTSSSPTFQSWTNSYFYFDATAPRRAGLDWWLEDLGTGETTSANPSDGQLVAWDFVAAPASLTGGLTPEANISLEWPKGTIAADGAFEIERQKDTGPWLKWGVVQPTAAATVSFVDDFASAYSAYRYRVRSVFGPSRSAPSPVFYVGDLLDSDGDGITDAEEAEIAANPLLGPDAQKDSDEDGISDAQERLDETDPYDFYNARVPSLTSVSGQNQTGLPNRFYSAPLILRVTFSGAAMIGAPVTVKAGTGGGRAARTNDKARASESLTIRTGPTGEATFWLEAPADAGPQVFVARAGATTIDIPVHVDYALGAPAPQSLTTEWIGNGTRLTWASMISPPGSLEVERSTDRKVWYVIQTLPGNAVSYIDYYISTSPVVFYRLTSLPTPP